MPMPARAITRELMVGLLSGIAFAMTVYVWFEVPGLGIVIGLAMVCNLIAAALGGILGLGTVKGRAPVTDVARFLVSPRCGLVCVEGHSNSATLFAARMLKTQSVTLYSMLQPGVPRCTRSIRERRPQTRAAGCWLGSATACLRIRRPPGAAGPSGHRCHSSLRGYRLRTDAQSDNTLASEHTFAALSQNFVCR